MDNKAPIDNKDPRSDEEIEADSMALSMEPEIQKWCPVSYLGSAKQFDKVVKENPEAGTESPCKNCRWYLGCAEKFLNCAVIVFTSKENYQYSNSEIAEMLGVSSDTVRGILNSGNREFIRKVNSKNGRKFKKNIEQTRRRKLPPSK